MSSWGYFANFQKPSAGRTAAHTTALLALHFYRAYLSGIFGGNCRYYPSCSCYAEEAFRKYSFFSASKLAFLRVVSCRPFGAGGYDPVPEVSQHE